MTNPPFEKDLGAFLEKVEAMKQSGSVDLSLEEDMSIAVMNLVSLEEHFFFTGAKTGELKYFDFLGEVREMRKALMKKMLPAHEGETWCASKHLLAASMRLIEVGTKLRGAGKTKEAEEAFAQAYRLYALFWGIRLKFVDLAGVKRAAASEKKPWTLEEIVEKMVDCCDE